MHIDWEPLRAIIDSHQRFILTSHVRPDADALGSELGLAALLEALGKSVRIVNASPTPRRLSFLDPENRVLQYGVQITEAEVIDTDVHIVVDTSAWGQLAEVGTAWKKSSAVKVVIDHHVSCDALGAVEFKDVEAEATGAMIYRLADALGYPVTTKAAVPLFCALATDTGWYRFSSTTSNTLRIAAALIDAGAQPNLLYQQLYEQYSLGRVKLTGRVLSRVKLDCDGRVAYTYVRWDDYAETQTEPADTEDLVNECMRIGGTECAFILIEQSNRFIKVSFRSRTSLDVARVAEQFRGGGHKQAAGAILPGPLAEAESTVLIAMKTALGA
ncbi:MAG TPA: bifunctional oligoribonuclease/PAP phosphatase NrnA [Planctomycetaceae bacterium]|nr:bifunctional oligoribonuclease/PAP phosphatase NrnA [Planctomycetaceae bacterium]